MLLRKPIANRCLLQTTSACALIIGAALVSMPQAASAQTWTGAVSNDYADGGNWSGGVAPPPAGTVVTINTTATAPVVDSGDDVSADRLLVGPNSAATLTVRGGGILRTGTVGVGGGQIDGTAGDGTMLITGAGTLVTAVNQIFVAPQLSSRGNLTVAAGAVLRGNSLQIGTADRSVGIVTVTGAGSLIDHGAAAIFLGNRSANAGVGTLNILDGGRVTGTDSTTHFVGVGSAININGPGSLLSSRSRLELDGALLVENGGEISFNTISVEGAATLRNGSMVTSVGGLGVIGGATLVADDSTITVATGYTVAGLATLRGTALSAQTISISQNGVLNIGGADGEAAGAAGTLAAQSITISEPNSRLVFNHTGPDLVVSATISGNGRVLHRSGATILTAANPGGSTVTGIDVSGGTLLSNGRLRASNVTVSGGGTLGGTGTVEASVAVTDGIIAPGSRGVGALTLGNLSLTAASVLNFELGAPGTPGVGSDLITLGNINTAGNLTLDGTLNVASVGGFGEGLYRLIIYKGTLTDNGLTIGTTPTGFAPTDLTVQTSVAQQINLVVGAPAPSFSSFSFWDGGNTVANRAIDGGAGTWTTTGQNWTVSTGEANGVYDPGQLLIFSGAGGVVTVDTTPGAVTIARGLQFATNGYRVEGGDLSLGTSPIVLRVGDGTAAGAGISTTIASNLIGGASIEKTDLGTLILTGTAAPTGGTTISNGTLQIGAGGATGSIGGDIVNNGSLVFNRAGTFDYAGVVSGAGSLEQRGPGTLTLSGVHSYTGATTVSRGTLAVTGTLSGNVIVQAPATLIGTGRVGALDVAGRVSPGGAIGSLNVTGDVIFRAGSTYAVDLAAAGGGDRILAGGRATLEGGTVAITTLDPETDYRDGSVFRILNATGGLTGTFAGLTETSAFLDFTLGYDPTGALITISQIRTFPDVALTFNQRQAADALKVLDRTGGSDALAVYNDLLMLDENSARSAFDASSGEIYASLLDARQRAAIGLARQFSMRGYSGLVEGVGVWGGLISHDGRVAGDGNGGQIKVDGLGDELGADYRGEANGWAVGVGGGWQSGDVALAARASRAEVDSWHLGGYARYGAGSAGFTALATGVHSQADADVARRISFGTIDRTARANSDVRTTALSLDLRYGFSGGKVVFGPAASINYASSSLDRFSERDADALALSAGRNSDDWTRFGIGGFARATSASGYIDLSARMVTGDRSNASANLKMAGSAQAFTVRAARGAVTAAEIQVSTAYDLGGNWSVAGQAGFVGGDGDAEFSGNLRIGLRF
ncbi:MAG: autotransporter domain-containing protein [Caulobacter sp.]